MARFRQRKKDLRDLLARPGQVAFFTALEVVPPLEAVSPLLAVLPDGGISTWRAVAGLGLVVNRLAEENLERARTVMRRLTWHMNGDSGNMGWGVAESMGEILAQTPCLAVEYGRILLSYARPTDKNADNYIESGLLRRGLYWGIGRFVSVYVPLRSLAVTLLAAGLRDVDESARGVAAWSLGQMAEREKALGPEWRGVADALREVACLDAPCEVLQGEKIRAESAGLFAGEALAILAVHQKGRKDILEKLEASVSC